LRNRTGTIFHSRPALFRKEIVMRCPRDGQVLEGTDYRKITIDFCKYCNGSWLDKSELAGITRKGKDILSDTEETDYSKLPPSPFACPRCGGKVVITHYTTNKEVEIDRCTGCGGIWLDTDELKEIIRLSITEQ